MVEGALESRTTTYTDDGYLVLLCAQSTHPTPATIPGPAPTTLLSIRDAVPASTVFAAYETLATADGKIWISLVPVDVADPVLPPTTTYQSTVLITTTPTFTPQDRPTVTSTVISEAPTPVLTVGCVPPCDPNFGQCTQYQTKVAHHKTATWCSCARLGTSTASTSLSSLTEICNTLMCPNQVAWANNWWRSENQLAVGGGTFVGVCPPVNRYWEVTALTYVTVWRRHRGGRDVPGTQLAGRAVKTPTPGSIAATGWASTTRPAMLITSTMVTSTSTTAASPDLPADAREARDLLSLFGCASVSMPTSDGLGPCTLM
ncbi:hypothetical protein LTR08_007816 [Meristemomyces frigidus]|nr:hypothetical protein LTR08_007816 [Meristemomyces frigidus]